VPTSPIRRLARRHLWPQFSPQSFGARAIALTLAIWSHGPKTGAPADRCFPARADHFLRYLSTGRNDPPSPDPA
jgi:hypothetical protein